MMTALLNHKNEGYTNPGQGRFFSVVLRSVAQFGCLLVSPPTVTSGTNQDYVVFVAPLASCIKRIKR